MGQKFWIIHFLDEREKFIDTEEMIFPTDLTKENIEAAIKDAENECKVNGYKFVCLDLIDEGSPDIRCWCFPKDIECFT